MAIELGWRKETTNHTCKLTDIWSLHELKNPLIVAEKLHITPPENAKVVVANTILQKGNVKKHPGVRGNFVLGENRALLFTGEIKKGQLALWTIDEVIIKKLRNEFYRLWKDTPENLVSAPTPPNLGTKEDENEEHIRIQGRVRAIVPFRDGYLLRISTEDRVMGVMVDERLELTGKMVEVKGQLTMEDHPLLIASQINEINKNIERIE
jgi:hypothetical protein